MLFVFPSEIIPNYHDVAVAVPPYNKCSLIMVSRDSNSAFTQAETYRKWWVENFFLRNPAIYEYCHIRLFEGLFKTVFKHAFKPHHQRRHSEGEKDRLCTLYGSRADGFASALNLPKDQDTHVFLVDPDGACIFNCQGPPEEATLDKLYRLAASFSEHRPIERPQEKAKVEGVGTLPKRESTPHIISEMLSAGISVNPEQESQRHTEKLLVSTHVSDSMKVRCETLENALKSTSKPVGMARSVNVRESITELPEKSIATSGIEEFSKELETCSAIGMSSL
ncbi:hypothetical protein RCL1_003454 [Eukaryota sp. TZLM3-RCL]